MTTRREEERNEKIIRGLMKLPPNRRCINCNSLGPQYVCTNFWTFVCMTCSGIHREFTHRVKSVSMSKFTSQEVEALQEGGNQRARDTFLKDWDPRRQRLPDSSNADKVREFIKSVFVDRKYSGAKTSDKPPRNVQNLRNHADETRRASSYHSYSQSPPYDYQYEERRYGKLAPALTRKPGSDRGNYEGKNSFFSPSRFNDHVHEDRFANEASNPQVSDYSVSSGGDPFRSDTQSPSFGSDIGFSSPNSETSRDMLSEDVKQYKVNTFSNINGNSDAYQVPHAQRIASSGSFGSLNSNSMCVKSVDHVTKNYVASASDQSVGTHHKIVSSVPSLPQSSESGKSDGLELFAAPFIAQTVLSTASAIDLFQLPEASSTVSVDFFQPSPISIVLASNSHQESQAIPPSSLDLLTVMPHQQSAATLKEKLPDLGIQKNEGWATFDVSQHMEPSQGIESLIPATIASTNKESLEIVGELSSLNTSSHWSPYQDSCTNGPSSMHNQWHEGLHNVGPPYKQTSNQSWSAFENSIGQVPFQSIDEQNSGQVVVQDPSVADQYLVLGMSEDFQNCRIQGPALDARPPIFSVPSPAIGSSNASSTLPVMEGAYSHGIDLKSSNPFDLPGDSDFESSNMYLDMSSLQDALPNGDLPTSFISGVTQPWFPQITAVSYTPAGQQGALGFMAGQAPSMQIPNIPSQGPVAYIGGNPFE